MTTPQIGLTFKHCRACFAVLPFEPNRDWDARRIWECENCGQLQEEPLTDIAVQTRVGSQVRAENAQIPLVGL